MNVNYSPEGLKDEELVKLIPGWPETRWGFHKMMPLETSSLIIEFLK